MRYKWLFLVTMVALLLAACTPPQSTEISEPESSGDETAEAGNEGTITLRVWGHQNNSFNQATQEAIDQFVADHPGVEVKFETFPWDVFIQTIQTSLPAGNTADLIQLPGGFACRYADGGQILEVPADVMTLAQAEEIYYSAPLGGYACDGKLVGFPQEYNIEYGGAYVNEALFEEAGLAYPPAWDSWDAVVADAHALTQYNEDGSMKVAGLHFTNNDQLYTYLLA